MSPSPSLPQFPSLTLPFADKKTRNDLQSCLSSCIAGCAVFSGTLALSTFSQLKILGVSTGAPPPIPSALGICSVMLASVASQKAAVEVSIISKDWKEKGWKACKNDFKQRRSSDAATFAASLDKITVSPHTLRICCLGILTFQVLRGKYFSISPSSYTNLGSFARKRFSLSATEKYASSSQRVAIERMGRRAGCHTCGSRAIFSRANVKFHGDHMPPLSVKKQMESVWWREFSGKKVVQRFYPQCVGCSNQQGGILAKATSRMKRNLSGAGGGRMAHFHGLRFRCSHLTGGVVAGVAVCGTEEGDVRLEEADLALRRQAKKGLKWIKSLKEL